MKYDWMMKKKLVTILTVLYFSSSNQTSFLEFDKILVKMVIENFIHYTGYFIKYQPFIWLTTIKA